jgi:Protein of unknown function (DUF2812).
MKHVIRKAYWNYEKEEKWLNALAAKGLALTDYSWFRYVFGETAPGEYVYRIELLDQLATHPESRRYIAFVEDTGAECVATYLRWVYFRKKAAEGPFELFSDNTSRIAHYRRIRAFWLAFAALEFAAFSFNLAVGLILPISTVNLVCAGVLGVLLVPFSFLYVRMTRHIRRLRREQKITEG